MKFAVLALIGGASTMKIRTPHSDQPPPPGTPLNGPFNGPTNRVNYGPLSQTTSTKVAATTASVEVECNANPEVKG